MALTQGFVYESAPIPSCHASTLAEIGNGDLAAAWFGGTQEGAADVGIWFARRILGHWLAPSRVALAAGVPCWNPVLHRSRDGPLLLFYKAGPSPTSWSGFLIRSGDDGLTWTDPELLPAGILGPVKNKPFELPDGTLVCGTSVESYQAWGCWVERTRDAGRSWTKHGPINIAGHPYGCIQPAVFGSEDGNLAMVCRTRGLGKVVRGTSADGGNTWSALEPVDLPQNNSGLDAVRLRDGRVVLVYNHTTAGRTPLNLAVSRDMGRTWSAGPVLENEPGEYSYPAIIQRADGTIEATYTWRRQRIRWATLLPGDLPAAGG